MKNDPNKNGMTYTSHTLANKNRMTYASHTLPSRVCVCEVYVIPFMLGMETEMQHSFPGNWRRAEGGIIFLRLMAR